MPEKSFLNVYRFAGVPFIQHMTTANRQSAEHWARSHASARRASVPQETTELISVIEVDDESANGTTVITQREAMKLIDDVRTRKAANNLPDATDIDPDAPNRVLSESIWAGTQTNP